MEWFSETKNISSLFAVVALVATVFLLVGSDRNHATQLLGSLLVMSIAFSAHHVVVYTISVFVIATLVTELLFLEKIAALIWNRKEYWNYLLNSATQEDIEKKVQTEIDEEMAKNFYEAPDEVKATEAVNQIPEGIEQTEQPNLNRQELIQNHLMFENKVFSFLNKENIPFPCKSIRRELKIESGGSKYVIDGIIESDKIHYLIEVKNVNRINSLIYTVNQLEKYKKIYENYLNERNVRVVVQPLLIVPNDAEVPEQFRGLPVVKFNVDTGKFYNLKATYLTSSEGTNLYEKKVGLDELLKKFLRKYSRWAFSPLRIQKWGGKQPGYESFNYYTTTEIREELERLMYKGELSLSTSDSGNKLYKIKD